MLRLALATSFLFISVAAIASPGDAGLASRIDPVVQDVLQRE